MVTALLELEAVSPAGERKPLTVEVFAPERAEADWVCTIRFTGYVNKTVRSYGVDSWQALQLALSLVHTNLRFCDAELHYLEEPITLSDLFRPLTTE